MRLRDRLEGLAPPLSPPPSELEPLAPRAFAPPGAKQEVIAARLHELDRRERIAQLRALIAAVEAPANESGVRRRPAGPQPLPFGTTRATEAGALHTVERTFEPEHCHGRVVVRDALSVDCALLARIALEPQFEGVDLSRMLILDTETTGLSGGAGTVPFLIGLGGFEDGVLKVEQLFLRNLGGEAPLLRRLAERVAEASMIVTYNGKAFDWPLLRTRFVLNRVPLPAAPLHLDLLHCARRVWKPRLASVRLTEVEHAVLGLLREDDVDGSLIPGLYLRYLRGEDPQALAGVLAHNENDVVALAAVLWRICAHFAEVHAADDPEEHLAYAKVALRAGDLTRARAFARAAVEGGGAREVRLRALEVQARLSRRLGEPQAEAIAWREALGCVAAGAGEEARVHLALSRLYEHKLKDLAQAYRHARFTVAAEGAEAHGRRLGRLHRKLERG